MTGAVVASSRGGPAFTVGNRQPFGAEDSAATGGYNFFWFQGSAFSATKAGDISHITVSVTSAVNAVFYVVRYNSPGLYELVQRTDLVALSSGLQTVSAGLSFSTGDHLGMWIGGSAGDGVYGTFATTPDPSLTIMAPAAVYYNGVQTSENIATTQPSVSAPGVTATVDINDNFTDMVPHIYGYGA